MTINIDTDVNYKGLTFNNESELANETEGPNEGDTLLTSGGIIQVFDGSTWNDL